MRRFPLFSVIFALVIFSFSQCTSKPDNTKRLQARALYTESVRMIKHFSDSMRSASDSARVEELAERFMHDLTALNFKFPTDTDLEMSEGENDTLINLTERYILLRDSMLHAFAHPVELSDSLPVDSISTAGIDL